MITENPSMIYTPDIGIIRIGLPILNPDAAIIPPRNNEPVSPINILAGCRLKVRKASDEPMMTEAVMAVAGFENAEI